MPSGVKPDITLWRDALRNWLKDKPKAAVAAGLGLLFVLGWFLYGPPLGDIGRLQARKHQLRTEATQARDVFEQLRQEEWSRLPRAETIPEILAELHALAEAHTLKLVEVAPRSPAPKGEGLVVLPVELRIEGAYRPLGEFLGALRQTPALGVVSVQSVRIGREQRLLPRLKASISLELALGQ